METHELSIKCEIPEVYTISLSVDSDEIVTRASLKGGFAARGIGRLVTQRYSQPDAAILVIERICGICSHAHTMAFSQAVEHALRVTIPRRAVAVRTLIAELERMQSHSLNLAEVSALAKAQQSGNLAWAIRDKVTQCLTTLTDNRIHYGMNQIGGITRDVSQVAVDAVLTRLDSLGALISQLDTAYEQEARSSLEGIGVWLPTDTDAEWGTGPNGRAAGLAVDIRAEQPYSAYGWSPMTPTVERDGCCWARSQVRLRELRQSLDLIHRLSSDLPKGIFRSEEIPAVPSHPTAVATVEAPRGANRHGVSLTPEGLIQNLEIEVPTPRSIHGLERALISHHRRDVQLIVGSFDLCMSCTDGTR